MNRIAVISGAILTGSIAGCTIAPEDRGGREFRFESGRTPYAAAICVARNARERFTDFAVEERLHGRSSWEVVVRAARRPSDPLALAQMHDNGLGSRVVIHVGPSFRGDREKFARQLMTDCQAQMVGR